MFYLFRSEEISRIVERVGKEVWIWKQTLISQQGTLTRLDLVYGTEFTIFGIFRLR